VLCAGLVFSLFLAGGRDSVSRKGQGQDGQELKVISKEDAQEVASNFLRNSPTFRFDGIDNTLKLIWSGGDEATS